MKQILHHLFLPHFSNNQRAKLLHHSSILFVILALFIGQFFVSYVKTDYPAVLGSSIDISTERLLELTNKDRADQHLSPLTINPLLSQAAAMKADYMFQKDFWAHNAPDGTTPWYFFKKVGYTYTYAGENLARGFTDSDEVVQAWMNSPTHRENMLSSNYKEIGFAIKKGRLLGEDTTLVVEMFGNTDIVPLANTPGQSSPQIQANVLPAAIDTHGQEELPGIVNGYMLKTTSLLSSRAVTSSIGFIILITFIGILIVDLVVIERKSIVRVVGHNIDHIFFLSAIFVIMIVILRGVVL
jgi:hypothetical protein